MSVLRPFDRHRPRRIVHLAEGNLNLRRAKTTTGVLRYGVHPSVAIVDSVTAGRTAQDVLGFGGAVPVVATLAEARAFSPDTLLIGIAPSGGKLPTAWRTAVMDALRSGMDVISGLHMFLGDDAEFAEAALAGKSTIWDVRCADAGIPVGAARCLGMKSHICLMVGTDCAVGKMTVALEVQKTARERGLDARFVATGQTGMMIAGWGSPVDAIAGDFMAGAVERDVLSQEGADLVLVEGQGSLLHPGYSSVTLGLLHGAMPHTMVLCLRAGQDAIDGESGTPIPPLREVCAMYTQLLAPHRKASVVAAAVNTAHLGNEEAMRAVLAVAEELGLPATDPVRFGGGVLVDAVEAARRA